MVTRKKRKVELKQKGMPSGERHWLDVLMAMEQQEAEAVKASKKAT